VAEEVKRGVEALREIGKTVGNILVQALSFGATLLTNTAKALIELGHAAVEILQTAITRPGSFFTQVVQSLINLGRSLARRFNLQDPSYTLAAHTDARLGDFQHATDDLSSHRVDHALVIRFESLAAATMIGYWLRRQPVPESQALPSLPSAHAWQIKAEALPPRDIVSSVVVCMDWCFPWYNHTRPSKMVCNVKQNLGMARTRQGHYGQPVAAQNRPGPRVDC